MTLENGFDESSAELQRFSQEVTANSHAQDFDRNGLDEGSAELHRLSPEVASNSHAQDFDRSDPDEGSAELHRLLPEVTSSVSDVEITTTSINPQGLIRATSCTELRTSVQKFLATKNQHALFFFLSALCFVCWGGGWG